MTFEEWWEEVDACVWNKVGCSASDLPDTNSRDMYDDGLSPEDAAKRIIDYAKGKDDD